MELNRTPQRNVKFDHSGMAERTNDVFRMTNIVDWLWLVSVPEQQWLFLKYDLKMLFYEASPEVISVAESVNIYILWNLTIVTNDDVDEWKFVRICWLGETTLQII